jgi:hypothetical protein
VSRKAEILLTKLDEFAAELARFPPGGRLRAHLQPHITSCCAVRKSAAPVTSVTARGGSGSIKPAIEQYLNSGNVGGLSPSTQEERTSAPKKEFSPV